MNGALQALCCSRVSVLGLVFSLFRELRAALAAVLKRSRSPCKDIPYGRTAGSYERTLVQSWSWFRTQGKGSSDYALNWPASKRWRSAQPDPRPTLTHSDPLGHPLTQLHPRRLLLLHVVVRSCGSGATAKPRRTCHQVYPEFAIHN